MNQINKHHNKARRHVVIGGAVILLLITVLSSVSSFMIYRVGFQDFPYKVQQLLALFAVIVVEGAFAWLVYGFTRAFSSAVERLICLCGIIYLVGVMLINMVTHFMIVKQIPLSDLQTEWVAWGAVSVFICVLIIVLMITLADPVVRLIRLELRYMGLQQEKILEAKTEGLESQHVLNAMSDRAVWEAQELAKRILGDAAGRSRLQASNQLTAPVLNTSRLEVANGRKRTEGPPWEVT